MNFNSSFVRKIAYLAAIALLWIPLFFLGLPATRSGTESEPGGKLARMRAEYGLSQAELGEIDPASETMKMATLGLRGVATTVLWNKANEYKKTQNWEQLSATLEQIAKLQPNYISVWEYQAHNISYNVSVEFDDYRHRYHWVKKGIDYLIEGTKYNRREPRLFWTSGWFLGQKIGRADEHRQFRRLFAEDEDFQNLLGEHIQIEDAAGPDGLPDNWLAAYLWYRKAENVEGLGIPITWLREDLEVEGMTSKRRSLLLFYADAPMTRMNHAAQIEDEGWLDEKAQYAWRRAHDEWLEYGSRQIPTSYGTKIRLNDLERVHQDIAKLESELDKVVPGAREKLHEQKLAQLTEKEREALKTPADERTTEDVFFTALDAEQKTAVAHSEIADQASSENEVRAQQISTRLDALQELARHIDSYRNIVNFAYWRMRSEVEQQDEAIEARRLVHEADRLYNEAVLTEQRNEETGETTPGAKELYEAAWDLWAEIFAEYPPLMEDQTAENLAESIRRYEEVLGHLNQQMPEDFKLQKLREMYDERYQSPSDDPVDGEAAPAEESASEAAAAEE